MIPNPYYNSNPHKEEESNHGYKTLSYPILSYPILSYPISDKEFAFQYLCKKLAAKFADDCYLVQSCSVDIELTGDTQETLCEKRWSHHQDTLKWQGFHIQGGLRFEYKDQLLRFYVVPLIVDSNRNPVAKDTAHYGQYDEATKLIALTLTDLNMIFPEESHMSPEASFEFSLKRLGEEITKKHESLMKQHNLSSLHSMVTRKD